MSISKISFILPGLADMMTTRSARYNRLIHAVGHKENGLPMVFPDAQQLFLEQYPRVSIQRTERLVHQQYFGIIGKGSGDGHPLAHAAGQFMRERSGKFRHPHHVEIVICYLQSFALLQTRKLRPDATLSMTGSHGKREYS